MRDAHLAAFQRFLELLLLKRATKLELQKERSRQQFFVFVLYEKDLGSIYMEILYF